MLRSAIFSEDKRMESEMKNLMFLIAGLGVATVLVSSQANSPQGDLTVSKTKERIWAAAQSRNG